MWKCPPGAGAVTRRVRGGCAAAKCTCACACAVSRRRRVRCHGGHTAGTRPLRPHRRLPRRIPACGAPCRWPASLPRASARRRSRRTGCTRRRGTRRKEARRSVAAPPEPRRSPPLSATPRPAASRRSAAARSAASGPQSPVGWGGVRWSGVGEQQPQALSHPFADRARRSRGASRAHPVVSAVLPSLRPRTARRSRGGRGPTR